jgi:hypothetical protein
MGARPILPSRGSLTRSSHSPARSASGFHLSAGRQWRARPGRRVIDAITDEGSGDRPRSISPERHPRQRVATADPPRRVDREQRLALEAWRAADSSQPAPSVSTATSRRCARRARCSQSARHDRPVENIGPPDCPRAEPRAFTPTRCVAHGPSRATRPGGSRHQQVRAAGCGMPSARPRTAGAPRGVGCTAPLAAFPRCPEPRGARVSAGRHSTLRLATETMGSHAGAC